MANAFSLFIEKLHQEEIRFELDYRHDFEYWMAVIPSVKDKSKASRRKNTKGSELQRLLDKYGGTRCITQAVSSCGTPFYTYCTFIEQCSYFPPSEIGMPIVCNVEFLDEFAEVLMQDFPGLEGKIGAFKSEWEWIVEQYGKRSFEMSMDQRLAREYSEALVGLFLCAAFSGPGYYLADVFGFNPIYDRDTVVVRNARVKACAEPIGRSSKVFLQEVTFANGDVLCALTGNTRYVLKPDAVTTVGREASSSIITENRNYVSREHFRIYCEDGIWVLENRSPNLTCVIRNKDIKLIGDDFGEGKGARGTWQLDRGDVICILSDAPSYLSEITGYRFEAD